jgi:hypothetical protein
VARGAAVSQRGVSAIRLIPGSRRRAKLTADQAAGRGLPVVEKVDRRYRPPRIHEAIEVEALSQGEVTGIVRDALDALLPEPLDQVREREANQREAARSVIARLIPRGT